MNEWIGELTDLAVILVQIMSVVREDDIGIDGPLERLELVLHRRAFVREISVAEVVDHEIRSASLAEKELRARLRFLGADVVATERDPVNREVWVVLE